MITNPGYLSKDRLKSELKSHGIKFNNNENKQYYVNIYYKHIIGEDNSKGEFSSDEDLSKRVPKQEKKQQAVRKRKSVKIDTYLPSIVELTDNDLLEELRIYGADSGPITDTTREVYQRKLAKLMSEKATGKSAAAVVAHNVQPAESSGEEQEEGNLSETRQNESYIGEWSSEDDSASEEDKRVKTDSIKPVDRILHPGKGKGKSEAVRREPRNKGSLPSIPKAKHAKSACAEQSHSSSSFLCSFLFLILVFAVAFLAYEHYTSEDKPSIVTSSWGKFQAVVYEYMPEPVSTSRLDQPEPATDQPEPATDQPEPDTDQPEPDTDQPEPDTDQPEPDTDQPEPATDQPEPATDQPEPDTDQPEPADEPATRDQPSAEEPATRDQPSAEEPATRDQPSAKEPATRDQPSAEKPATQNQPSAKEPAEKPSSEPKVEVPSDTVKEPKPGKAASKTPKKPATKQPATKADSKPNGASKPSPESAPKSPPPSP